MGPLQKMFKLTNPVYSNKQAISRGIIMQNKTNRLIYFQLAPRTVAASALTFLQATILLSRTGATWTRCIKLETVCHSSQEDVVNRLRDSLQRGTMHA